MRADKNSELKNKLICCCCCYWTKRRNWNGKILNLSSRSRTTKIPYHCGGGQSFRKCSLCDVNCFVWLLVQEYCRYKYIYHHQTDDACWRYFDIVSGRNCLKWLFLEKMEHISSRATSFDNKKLFYCHTLLSQGQRFNFGHLLESKQSRSFNLHWAKIPRQNQVPHTWSRPAR